MTTKVTNVYNLKLTPSQFGQSSVVVNCSQYDSLFRVIQFNLYNGINEFSIPDNCVVTIRGTKKDLTGFEYQCEYEGNVVTFPIQDQVTVLPGKVPAEIRVTSGNEIIGSWNFVFLVEESPLDENTIISETDLPLLESALEAAAQAESFKNLAEQSAIDASTSATEASDSASTATTKAEESAESALKSEGYAVGEQNGEPVDETSIYYHNNAKWYSQSGGGTHNYEELANKPSINNVTLVGDKSLSDLGVPTKTSDLTNDSGYITIASVPTKTSDLTNDSGFLTEVPHATSSAYGTVKVDMNGDPPAGYIKLTYGNDRDIYTPLLLSTSDTIRSKFLPSATTSTKGAVIVDSAMSDSSVNPVQNSVVKAYVDANTGTISATSDGQGIVTLEIARGE